MSSSSFCSFPSFLPFLPCFLHAYPSSLPPLHLLFLSSFLPVSVLHSLHRLPTALHSFPPCNLLLPACTSATDGTAVALQEEAEERKWTSAGENEEQVGTFCDLSHQSTGARANCLHPTQSIVWWWGGSASEHSGPESRRRDRKLLLGNNSSTKEVNY